MLKFLKKEANMTHTENGAVTYGKKITQRARIRSNAAAPM